MLAEAASVILRDPVARTDEHIIAIKDHLALSLTRFRGRFSYAT